MDRRTRKTEAAIYAAFSELLNNYKYSQITVDQIISLADVGRSTFYSHFDTKDELLKSMCLNIFESISLHNHNANTADSHLVVTELLRHIKMNKKSIKGVISGESGNLFMGYFKSYFNTQVEELLNRLNIPCSTVPKDFLVNHISGSFIEMIEWWVKNDMKQTPEELTAYYFYVIAPLFIKH